ncbi:uncharacterized protein LOC116026114 [Ipomoea triloba]|uniref:uncharacterized protein LOC116026114 n=1 Tax=Ipomoea triloba TaxID=35885 RepID=UPI00125DD59E|nr:uncharacterized protein LOC116026114 [Ipomoea triloba]XP_031123425.1 uncharacterized protein LOC116026114 [Ipomoea triloba]
MEEEYWSDIFEDASETFEDENIQQLQNSLQIRGNFCPNAGYHQYNGQRLPAEWTIDMHHIQRGGIGGGEEEGEGGDRAEEEGGGGGGEGSYGEEEEEEEEEEVEEDEEDDGGEGDGEGEIQEEEEEEEVEEDEEDDEGEGEIQEEVEEEREGGLGGGNRGGENDKKEANGGGYEYNNNITGGGGRVRKRINNRGKANEGHNNNNNNDSHDYNNNNTEGSGRGGNDYNNNNNEGSGRGGNDRGEANVGVHPHLSLPYNMIGRSSPMKCIFRVPKYTLVIEKRTYTPQTISIGPYPYTPQTVSIGPYPYTPQIVSIGPYHYGNPKLSRMESQKKLLFESMRCNPDRRLSLTAAMTEFEAKARKCYSTKFNNIDADTFREMMLIDAFFIIHTFLSFDRWCKNPDDGELQRQPIFGTAWRQGNICQDLLMLENQVPFFILVKVYAILTNESNEGESGNCLKKLAMQFFKQVEFGRIGGGDSVTIAEDPKHLLDLFHSSFVVAVDKRKTQKLKKVNTTSSSSSSSSLPLLKMKTNCWVNSASELSSNGVKFIGTKKGNPLDIQFVNFIGHLRVPTLCINDTTVTVLKNLVAYEQGSPLTNPYFTTLAIFFSNIAPTPDDIKLLREENIINHQPADDGEVVLLLQQLNKASQKNGFNACLIKHHLQLLDRYLLSGQSRVISVVRKRGGVDNLIFHLLMFLFLTIIFSLVGNALGKGP